MDKPIKNLMEAMRNPIQSKLLLNFHTGNLTAKQLLEANKDIPQATIYRHLNKLAKEGIIKVVKENRIRGVVEKVYAFNIELEQNSLEYLTGETYMNMFTEYMMGFMQEFRAYTAQENIDIANSGSGFSLIPIYATKEELLEVGAKITEILMPLSQNTPSAERLYRNIGIIVTPPKSIE